MVAIEGPRAGQEESLLQYDEIVDGK